MDVHEPDNNWLEELPAPEKLDSTDAFSHDGIFLAHTDYSLKGCHPVQVNMSPIRGGQAFWMSQGCGTVTADQNRKIDYAVQEFLTEALSTPDLSVEQALRAALANLERYYLENSELDDSAGLEIALIYIRRHEVWVANVGSIQIALWDETFGNKDGLQVITELHEVSNREEAKRVDDHLDAVATDMDKLYHLSTLLEDPSKGPRDLTRTIGLRACKEENTGVIATPFVKKLPLDLDASNVCILIGTAAVWDILRREKINYNEIACASEAYISCGELLDAILAAHPESKKNAQRIFKCKECRVKLLASECVGHVHGEKPKSRYDLSFFGRGLGIAILDIFND